MKIAEARQTVSTEYNGWSNYETWLANLWLTNDESNYALLQEALSKDMWRTYEQAEELEQYVRWLVDTDERTGITSDLLTASLGRVNWHEIVEANQE